MAKETKKPKKYPRYQEPYIPSEKDITISKPDRGPALPPIEGNVYNKIMLLKGDRGSRGRKAASSAEKAR